MPALTFCPGGDLESIGPAQTCTADLTITDETGVSRTATTSVTLPKTITAMANGPYGPNSSSGSTTLNSAGSNSLGSAITDYTWTVSFGWGLVLIHDAGAFPKCKRAGVSSESFLVCSTQCMYSLGFRGSGIGFKQCMV